MSTSTKDFMAGRPIAKSITRKANLLKHNVQSILSDWQPATMKWYDTGKGFGFVILPDGKEAFLHASIFRAAGFIAYSQGMPLEVRIFPQSGRLRVGDVREVKSV